MATDEELLQEIVDVLVDKYKKDFKRQGEQGRNLDMSMALVYPEFTKAAKEAADKFKEEPDHRRLCSVPSFALGLAMASQIPKHYKHASWFNIETLTEMLESHGAVSDAISCTDDLTQHSLSRSSSWKALRCLSDWRTRIPRHSG